MNDTSKPSVISAVIKDIIIVLLLAVVIFRSPLYQNRASAGKGDERLYDEVVEGEIVSFEASGDAFYVRVHPGEIVRIYYTDGSVFHTSEETERKIRTGEYEGNVSVFCRVTKETGDSYMNYPAGDIFAEEGDVQ